MKLLLVLTGTSGSGKTTLCTKFLETIENTARVITTTTRAPRKGEAIFDEKYADKDLIMCTDVQGAQTLKAKFSISTMGRRLVTIFVSPVSLDELRNRLIMRGTDDEQTIQKRLQTAEKELHTLPQFDYHLCSQDREHDWLCLQHIYYSEKMRI